MPAARTATILTSLALTLACSASAPRAVTTRLEAPARPVVEMAVQDDPRGPTWTLTTDLGRTRGGLLRWLGLFGEVRERQVLASGDALPLRGRAPAFSVAWQLALSLEPVGGVPRFLVAGGPVLPDLAPGREHLAYLVEVVAPNLSRALELASPVADGLTDAPPRPAVEVLLHLTARFEPHRGLVLRASDTTPLRGARLLLDGGSLAATTGAPLAWQAHELHGWQRLEVCAPVASLAGPEPRRRLELQTGTGPSDLALATIELDLSGEP